MKLLDLLAESSLRIDELFMDGPKPAEWAEETTMGVKTWNTGFVFRSSDRDMKVSIELIDDHDQVMAKYMFRAAGRHLDPVARGFGINFEVDGTMNITGALGSEAARLIGEVLSRCMHFWNQHAEFSYVVFTGAEGSRNRLYAALARRLAAMSGARLITHRDDFMIYLPSAESAQDRMDERVARVGGRWALVSRKTGRPLQYYHGKDRPSPEWVKKVERRIQYFKHRGS